MTMVVPLDVACSVGPSAQRDCTAERIPAKINVLFMIRLNFATHLPPADDSDPLI